MKSYEELSKKLRVAFKQPSLLEKALTHRSFLNENRQVVESNERLEFLGDAVLELAVSRFLYKKYPQKPEGQLTSLRSKVVQTKTLAVAAKKLGIPDYLRMSKGEAESGGRENESLLADTFEAIIGAIFIDKGRETADGFIEHHLLTDLDTILKSKAVVDYKSQYQETVQAQGLPTPIYKIISESGPDHNKNFISAVLVSKKRKATGKGKSKQEAEQDAAKQALEKIKKKR